MSETFGDKQFNSSASSCIKIYTKSDDRFYSSPNYWFHHRPTNALPPSCQQALCVYRGSGSSGSSMGQGDSWVAPQHVLQDESRKASSKWI